MAKRTLNNLPKKGESSWKTQMIDALTDILTANIATDTIPIPLGDWRKEAYGLISAAGGYLGTDSTPILSQVGGKAPDIAWVAADVAPIIAQAQLPLDYQEGNNVVLGILAEQVGSNDDIDLDIECYITRAGVAVGTDVAPAVGTANRLTQGGARGTPELLSITILDATADFSRLDELTIIITPDAHANDAIYMQGTYLTYTRGGNLPDASQTYYAS